MEPHKLYLEGLNTGVDIGINAVVDALIDSGVLVALDGDVGYNGITTPKGVSSQILLDKIDDIIHENLSEAIKKELDEEVSAMIQGAM